MNHLAREKHGPASGIIFIHSPVKKSSDIAHRQIYQSGQYNYIIRIKFGVLKIKIVIVLINDQEVI